VDSILTYHPTSNIAISLLGDETKLSGIPLSALRRLDDTLRTLAEIEVNCASFCELLLHDTRFGSDERSTYLISLARAWWECGDRPKSREASDAVLDELDGLLYESTAMDRLLDLASVHIDHGDTTQAQKVALHALEFLRADRDLMDRNEYMLKTANVLTRLGQKAEACVLVDSAADLIKDSEYPISRSESLALLARSYGTLGEEKKRDSSIQRALSDIELLEGGYYVADQLLTLAYTYHDAAQHERAKELIMWALEDDRRGEVNRSFWRSIRIIEAFARLGYIEAAQAAASVLPSSESRAIAFATIVSAGVDHLAEEELIGLSEMALALIVDANEKEYFLPVLLRLAQAGRVTPQRLSRQAQGLYEDLVHLTHPLDSVWPFNE